MFSSWSIESLSFPKLYSEGLLRDGSGENLHSIVGSRIDELVRPHSAGMKPRRTQTLVASLLSVYIRNFRILSSKHKGPEL